MAERQGRYLAKALNKIAYTGWSTSLDPFVFKSMGMMTYIGEYQALSDLPEFKLTGCYFIDVDRREVLR